MVPNGRGWALIIAGGHTLSGAEGLQHSAVAGRPRLPGSAPHCVVVITDKDEVSRGAPRRDVPPAHRSAARQGVAAGDLVTLDVLKPETRRAYKEIAAAIVDGYR